MKLQVGQRGLFRQNRFEIIESLARSWSSGVAYDWSLHCEDGRVGRLIELDTSHSGPVFAIMVDFSFGLDSSPAPAFDSLKIGQRVPLNGAHFEVSEIQRYRFDGVPGPASIEEVTWAWLLPRTRGDEIGLVEYTPRAVTLFLGFTVSPEELARIFI